MNYQDLYSVNRVKIGGKEKPNYENFVPLKIDGTDTGFLVNKITGEINNDFTNNVYFLDNTKKEYSLFINHKKIVYTMDELKELANK